MFSETQKFVFVTGAPRSGTTYISDWITETPGCYCAHEVLRYLHGRSDDQIESLLSFYAATGADRGAFDRDRLSNTEINPQVIGFKEPIQWPVSPAEIPYSAGEFLEKVKAFCIVLIRHPFDVIASGKHRAINTNNWPGFTVEDHCQFWCSSIQAATGNVWHSATVFQLRWEHMVSAFDESKKEIEEFIGIEMPEFLGYQLGNRTIESLTYVTRESTLDLEKGLMENNKRDLLTEEDKETIRRITGDLCMQIGYKLS